MAQQLTTTNGTVLIPGGYSSITVVANPSGLSTTGVLMLVGEADAGPDYSLEPDLSLNSFGPDQLTDVVAKYKSGSLVDAFRGAIAAANDPNITGSFASAVLVKTNKPTQAFGTYLHLDTTSYGNVTDKGYGKTGNLIYKTVTQAQVEVVPTTGPFLLFPPINSTNIAFRINGGASIPLTLSSGALPNTMVSAIDALSGVAATGGVNRGALGVVTDATLALAIVNGNSVTVTRSIAWAVNPLVGDILYIPTGSILASGHATNAGGYVVTAVGLSFVNATKLYNATGSDTVVTAPTAVSAVTAATPATDMEFFSPVVISLEAGTIVDGLGKSLEIADLASATGRLIYNSWIYSATTGPLVATWISTQSLPFAISSPAETIIQLNHSRQLDNLSESLTTGGDVLLQLGYIGTSASVVITATTMTITVGGGTGTSPPVITLTDYPTISDLATYLNSLTGFSAAPGTTALGGQASTNLDQGTYSFSSAWGAYTGRIKQDAFEVYTAILNNSILVAFPIRATTGLPAVQSLQYLAGGAKGFTTDTTFNAAIDALEQIQGNFLVPLFSRDASLAIISGGTDPSSTYTIANIHAYSRAHVLKMSTYKRKRNRQAFLAIRTTFTIAKNTAGNIGSQRCCMLFEDVKDVGSNGVVQFHPWMAAVKAAAMQAAGFYRPIVRKGISISGVLQAAADYNPQNDSQTEQALKAGLLPIRQSETGTFYWVSDQTTYGRTDNFVYNSVQAVYVSDTIALTTQQRMEQAFAGQSVADVNASLALATLETIMDDMKRLKLIAPSDDAPKGFKNPSIKIVGPAMFVKVEVKLAGALYFIDLSFLVSQVVQSA